MKDIRRGAPISALVRIWRLKAISEWWVPGLPHWCPCGQKMVDVSTSPLDLDPLPPSAPSGHHLLCHIRLPSLACFHPNLIQSRLLPTLPCWTSPSSMGTGMEIRLGDAVVLSCLIPHGPGVSIGVGWQRILFVLGNSDMHVIIER
jgi:hypothetical protein